MTTENSPSANPAPRVAAALCLLGCFLYLVLSEPLLNALGFNYTGGAGGLMQKIHPGAMAVFASFVLLLICEGGRPRRHQTMRDLFPACACLFAVNFLIFVYAGARHGGHGLGFMIDTHMVVPVIALVLACAPPCWARKAALLFIAFAALDGAIGIGEWITHRRFYAFDPAWPVLHESYFRATSLMGSPLASDLFLPIALFAALGLDLPRSLKTGLIILLPLSLLAFGGFFALSATILGLIALGAAAPRQDKALLAVSTCIVTVLFAAQILCSPGAYTAAFAEYNSIANGQQHAFEIFRHINAPELIFGVSMDLIEQLAAGVGVAIPQSDIDDPWVLMVLIAGGGLFMVWLAATIGFFRALLRHQPPALIFAVLAYFIIASTSNSFGRKDVIYPATVGLAACAARTRKRTEAA